MASTYSAEPASIGLDDESWKALSSTDASSILRILMSSNVEDRTYSSVSVIPFADGRNLYIRPH